MVAKHREEVIEVIDAMKFQNLLKSKEIIEYGDEINDTFIEFLSVSKEYSEIIMLRKLKKALKEIKNWGYFE